MVVGIVEFTWLNWVIHLSLLTLMGQLKDGLKRSRPSLDNLPSLSLSLPGFHGSHLVLDFQEKPFLDIFVSRILVIVLFKPFVHEPDVIVFGIVNTILPLEVERPRINKTNRAWNALSR